MSNVKFEKRESFFHALIAAESVITDQQAKQALKSLEPAAREVAANHPTPDGDDISRMLSIWLDLAWIKVIMAATGKTGAQLRDSVFRFRETYKPQRKLKNSYMPLKSHPKLAAYCVALVTGNGAAYRNVNKYLATIVALPAASGFSEISNRHVYQIFGANQCAIDSLCDGIDDPEMRATLKSKALWKAESTASTQRPTSAWLLHIFEAGENLGNERVIRVDTGSDGYAQMLKLFFNVAE